MNKHLKSTPDVVVNVSVAEADVTAIIALAAVSAGASHAATSNAKGRIMFKTAETCRIWNENWKSRVMFNILES